MKQLKERLVFKFIFSNLSQVLQILSSAFGFAILSRVLNTDSFNNFIFAFTTSSLISILFEFGLNSVVLKKYIDKDPDSNLILSIILWLRIYFYAFYVLILAALHFIGFLSILQIQLQLILMLSVFWNSRFTCNRGAIEQKLKVEGKLNVISLSQIIDSVLFFVLILIFYYLKSGVFEFAAAWSLSSLPGFFLVSKYSPGLRSWKPNVKEFSEFASNIFPFVFPVALLVIIVGSISKIDFYIVSYFKPEMTGGYGILQRIESMSYFLVYSISNIYLPKVRGLYLKSEIESVALFKLILMIISIIGLSIVTIYILLGEQLILILFGEKFIYLYPFFVVYSCLVPIFFLLFFLNEWLIQNSQGKKVVRLYIAFLIFYFFAFSVSLYFSDLRTSIFVKLFCFIILTFIQLKVVFKKTFNKNINYNLLLTVLSIVSFQFIFTIYSLKYLMVCFPVLIVAVLVYNNRHKLIQEMRQK